MGGTISVMAHPGGRPTKLTPELQERIAGALLNGNYLNTAAAMNGVTVTSLFKWLKRGREADPNNPDDERYVEFLHACKEAQAKAEATDLGIITRAAISGTWQAAAWKLERKYPQQWGRQDKVNVEMTADVTVEAKGSQEWDQATYAEALALRYQHDPAFRDEFDRSLGRQVIEVKPQEVERIEAPRIVPNVHGEAYVPPSNGHAPYSEE